MRLFPTNLVIDVTDGSKKFECFCHFRRARIFLRKNPVKMIRIFAKSPLKTMKKTNLPFTQEFTFGVSSEVPLVSHHQRALPRGTIPYHHHGNPDPRHRLVPHSPVETLFGHSIRAAKEGHTALSQSRPFPSSFRPSDPAPHFLATFDKKKHTTMGNTHASPCMKRRGIWKPSLSRKIRRQQWRRDVSGAFPTFEESFSADSEDGSFPSMYRRGSHSPRVFVPDNYGDDKKNLYLRRDRNPLRRSLQRLKALSPKLRRDQDSATANSEEEFLFYQQLDKDYLPSIQESVWKVGDMERGDGVLRVY